MWRRDFKKICTKQLYVSEGSRKIGLSLTDLSDVPWEILSVPLATLHEDSPVFVCGLWVDNLHGIHPIPPCDA